MPDIELEPQSTDPINPEQLLGWTPMAEPPPDGEEADEPGSPEPGTSPSSPSEGVGEPFSASSPSQELDTTERAQLIQLKQQAREAESNAQITQIQNAGVQYMRHLMEEQGLDESTAKLVSDAKVAEVRATIIANQQMEQASTAGQRAVAKELALAYGVNEERLMRLNSPEEMKAVAVELSTDRKQLRNLEKEVKALKRGRIPAQEVDSGSGSASQSNNQRILAEYAAGKRNLTREEYLKLTS
jgi:hypothetical protein